MTKKQKINLAARYIQDFTGAQVVNEREVIDTVRRLVREYNDGSIDDENLKFYHLLGLHQRNGLNTLAHYRKE